MRIALVLLVTALALVLASCAAPPAALHSPTPVATATPTLTPTPDPAAVSSPTATPSPSPDPTIAASASPIASAAPTQLAIPNDPNARLAISGTVYDEASGAPIADACVTLGRPIVCWTYTDAEGRFSVGLPAAAPSGRDWELHALKQPDYAPVSSGLVTVTGRVTADIPLRRR